MLGGTKFFYRHMLAFAAKLAGAVDSGLSGALTSYASGANVDQKWIDECAADLVAHRGAALVVAGSHLPAAVHAIVEPGREILLRELSEAVGALVALFAILLLRGNRFGRAILGLSLLGDVVSGAYSSVALEDTVRLIGVAQIVGAVLALYLLYGTEKAQRYFD